MSSPENIAQPRRGFVLIRNSLWGVFAQVFTMALSFFATPYILSKLGDEAYGILALWGLLTGWFTFLNLGLGSATIKYVAEYYAVQDLDAIYRIINTSLAAYILLGALGGGLIAAATPSLVSKVFHISPGLLKDAQFIFYVSAVDFLINMPFGIFGAVPKALQRFDLVNLITISGITLQTGLNVLLLYLGYGLRALALLDLIISFLIVLINLYLTKRLIPSYSIKFSFDHLWLPRLFKYGLSDTARQIVNNLAMQANRLILGFMLPVSGLTFYTVPYSLLNRAFNFPGLILAALLPAFSATQKVGDRSSIHDLYLRANRYIMVFMMGITGLLAVFAKEFLTIWISPAFAGKAYVVLILLCLGGFLASTYSALITALQALNRPDIPAMLAPVNAILNILFCLILIPIWGINGAALAWVCAFLLPTPFFLYFMHRNVLRISNRRFLLESMVRPAIVTMLIILLAFFARFLVRTLPGLILIGGSLGVFYTLLTWFFVLDHKDRLTFSGYGLSLIQGIFSRSA